MSSNQHPLDCKPNAFSPPSTVGNALGLKSEGPWFEPAVNHYCSSNNVCLLAHVFTGEDPQSKWLKRDESNMYTGFRQDSYREYICRLFYHKGPALTPVCYISVPSFNRFKWSASLCVPELYCTAFDWKKTHNTCIIAKRRTYVYRT